MQHLLPLLCALSCLQGDGAAPANKDFALKAEVVESLEGGPLVVKAILSYNGPGRVEVFHNPWHADAFVESQPGWGSRLGLPILVHGFPVARFTLSSGDEKSEILRVHAQYAGIAAGKTKLKVIWNVREPSKDGENPGPLISELSTTVEIDIPPATPDRVDALRKRMEKALQRSDLTDRDERDLVQDILITRHRGLAPVAWRLIERPQPGHWTFELLDFVEDASDGIADLDVRLAKRTLNPDWGGEIDVFRHWTSRAQDRMDKTWGKLFFSPEGKLERTGILLPKRAEADLPAAAAWPILEGSKSVWTRTLTYVTFPKRCDKAWKESLFRDLSEMGKPLPDDRFTRLLADLDDERFDIREKATHDLIRLGERVEAPLIRSLEGSLSAEAQTRVKAVLEKLRTEKQPPDCKRAVEYLKGLDAPEADEILEVLAQGPPKAWLTQEAKGALEKRRKPAPPADK